ncbi:MAG: type I phosphomannose isomerase catalytic subunit [Chthoniobacterales bacterium]
MHLNEPITFTPLFMERLWGGRQLEKILKIPLPSSAPIGELWTLVDRQEAQSIVNHGTLRGKSLHDLWTKYRLEVFGVAHANNSSPQFPLLCKLLDASEVLSVQVHPPERQAALLKGEAKTECWYILEATPEATIYAGLRRGVTKEIFRNALEEGTVEKLLHKLPVKSGDSIFIPSGRLHAIGRGILLAEIQQNSDTTYRIFDWNRRDANGQQRQLHLEESMSSIDFSDYEPSLSNDTSGIVADCPFFHAEKWVLEKPHRATEQNSFSIFTCLTGKVACGSKIFSSGDFFLVPATMQEAIITPQARETSVLCTRLRASGEKLRY